MTLVAGIGLAAAACQDGAGYGTPTGYYQQPAPVYYQSAPAYRAPYYGNAYAPPPRQYGNPYGNQYGYAQQQQGSWYNKSDGRRYTSVTVTNRGQNGYRDDVVQQQVVCGSQYYDGYQTRTAPSC
ncbi:hypothetical protein [Reyranella sp.]|uniref:hypothetical protein n=1 Tax=Reyranella sp. TaxID=1929291 RepID=UPI003BA91917